MSTLTISGGEIRGQLSVSSVVNDPLFSSEMAPLIEGDLGIQLVTLTASLDGAQEPDDTSDSLATGFATVTIVVNGSEVTYSSTRSIDGITTADLLPVAGVSSIHIHNTPA